jgi:hypothetical protein
MSHFVKLYFVQIIKFYNCRLVTGAQHTGFAPKSAEAGLCPLRFGRALT